MYTQDQQAHTQNNEASVPMKFCRYCGQKVRAEAVLCPYCGCQIEEMQKQNSTQEPKIVINNTNSNVNTNTNINGKYGRAKNKWVAFFLCLFLGFIGAHKFYEDKKGIGILYLFTFGLFGIGWFIDTLVLLFKSNPYYV